MAETPETTGGGLAFRPLYAQVKARFIARMVSGEWAPGMLLPSEPQLAAEMGVSPGTVRKALNALHAENLIVRRQGRGTFVAEHTAQRALFRFFRLVGRDGERALPETVWSALAREPAAPSVAARLGLVDGAAVWRLRRSRALEGVVLVSETIHLAADDFPDLGAHAPLPNTLYSLYEKVYGRVVARAVEDISAVAADAAEADALGCPVGAPVLLIDRIAFGLDDRPVELRRSVCLTGRHRYRCDLR